MAQVMAKGSPHGTNPSLDLSQGRNRRLRLEKATLQKPSTMVEGGRMAFPPGNCWGL